MTKDDHIRQIKHNIACYLNDPSKNKKMLFLDTETTGLDDKAQAVSLAIVDEDCTVIVNTRLNVTVPISSGAFKVHKIKQSDLVDCPYFTDIQDDVKNLLNGRKVGIYNAEFDSRILSQSATIPMDNYTSICVMENAMFCLGLSHWPKLTYACSELGVSLTQAHDALSDAIATVHVWKKL